jgi:osmotically-inducible protein OsmY
MSILRSRGFRRFKLRSRGFRLQAEGLLLAVLLSACAATTSRTADDLTTTTQVKIALLNDARVGGLRLDVKTFQGVVTLSGTVKSDADAQQAMAVARTVHGVRRVASELKIQPQ